MSLWRRRWRIIGSSGIIWSMMGSMRVFWGSRSIVAMGFMAMGEDCLSSGFVNMLASLSSRKGKLYWRIKLKLIL